MAQTIFDAPIPGQSLTQEKGSTPMEQPPQFAKTDDALEYIFEKLTTKKQVVRLVLMLKKGVSVEYIARAMLFQGFSTGRWTPDNSMLMLRIVMAMIVAIATNAGVKNPTILNPDTDQEKFLDQFITDDMGEVTPDGTEVSTEEEVGQQMPEFTGILGAI